MKELIKANERIVLTQTSLDVHAGVMRSIGYIPMEHSEETGICGTPISWVIPLGRTETLRLALQEKPQEDLDTMAREYIEEATDVMISIHGYGANRIAMLPSIEQVLLGEHHEALAWNDQKKVIGIALSVMGSEHTIIDEKKFQYMHTGDQVMDALRGIAKDLPLFLKKICIVGHSMGGLVALLIAAAKQKEGVNKELRDDTEYAAVTPVVETKKHGHLKFFEGFSGKILTTINTIPVDALRNALMGVGMKIGLTQYLFDRLMLDPDDPNIALVRATHLRELKNDAAYLRAVTKGLSAVESLRSNTPVMDRLRQIKDKIHFIIAGTHDHILENNDMIDVVNELQIQVQGVTGEGHYSTSTEDKAHGLNIIRNIILAH